MKEPVIEKAEVSFIQDGNTMGTTEEIEQITICLEFQLPEKYSKPFFVIKTNGWSFDGIGELEELVKRSEKLLE